MTKVTAPEPNIQKREPLKDSTAGVSARVSLEESSLESSAKPGGQALSKGVEEILKVNRNKPDAEHQTSLSALGQIVSDFSAHVWSRVHTIESTSLKSDTLEREVHWEESQIEQELEESVEDICQLFNGMRETLHHERYLRRTEDPLSESMSELKNKAPLATLRKISAVAEDTIRRCFKADLAHFHGLLNDPTHGGHDSLSHLVEEVQELYRDVRWSVTGTMVVLTHLHNSDTDTATSSFSAILSQVPALLSRPQLSELAQRFLTRGIADFTEEEISTTIWLCNRATTHGPQSSSGGGG